MGKDTGGAIGCLSVIIMVIAFVTYAIHDDHVRAERWLNHQKQVVSDFKNPGKIVEIYAYRTGTKTANYRYPIGCVIEDQEGDRLVLKNIHQAAVEGDYWDICLHGTSIDLCNLVKKSTK